MKTAVLDTNVLIALFRGDRAIAEALSTFDRVLVPTVVLGEFKAGIAMDAKNGQLQRAALDEFLDAPSVEVVSIGEQTSDSYALVFKALKERGTPIPQNDIWIAAMAIERGAVLFSHDSHFALVPLLKTLTTACRVARCDTAHARGLCCLEKGSVTHATWHGNKIEIVENDRSQGGGHRARIP